MEVNDFEKRQFEAYKSRIEYENDPFCWRRVWGRDWVPYLVSLHRNPMIWIQRIILACWRNSFIGVLIITAGYFGTLVELASHLNDKIELLSKVEIKTWDDRRNLGLSVAGIIGGWLALLGLYYSAKRTRTLADDNQIKLDTSRQSNFLEAVTLLKDESPFVVSGAIEGLRKLGSEPDARYFSDTIHLLAAFIRETSNLPQKERMQSHINVNFTNIQNAFGALISIIDSHSDAIYEQHFEGWPVDLRHSSLDNIEVRSGSNLKNLDLSFCSFKSAKLWACRFKNTQLEGADLSDADLTDAFINPQSYDMLAEAKMDRMIISSCNFNELDTWVENQLATCRYKRSHPPKNIDQEIIFREKSDISVKYIYLATPFDFDRDYVDEDEAERHLNRAEAIDFYKRNPQYRPLDGDGHPITLIDPDDPNNPIID